MPPPTSYQSTPCAPPSTLRARKPRNASSYKAETTTYARIPKYAVLTNMNCAQLTRRPQGRNAPPAYSQNLTSHHNAPLPPPHLRAESVFNPNHLPEPKLRASESSCPPGPRVLTREMYPHVHALRSAYDRDLSRCWDLTHFRLGGDNQRRCLPPVGLLMMYRRCTR